MDLSGAPSDQKESIAAAEQRIPVYILSADPYSDNTDKVRQLFLHSIFPAHKIYVENPENIVNANDKDLEKARIMEVLRSVKDNYDDNYFIIIKDNSVSVATPEKIANVVRKAIKVGGWDIFYLSDWQDDCSQFTPNNMTDLGDLAMAKTKYAQGLQAVLISPDGRRMLMGEKPMRNGKVIQYNDSISNTLSNAALSGGINAATVVPNLINYDITKAKSAADYLKAQQCATPANLVNNKPITSYAANNLTGSNNNVWWWIAGLIILILIIWAIWYYVKKSKAKKVVVE